MSNIILNQSDVVVALEIWWYCRDTHLYYILMDEILVNITFEDHIT